MTKTIMRRERSAALFAEARLRIPGGVNSPVRACANVGCDPVFYERASSTWTATSTSTSSAHGGR